MHFLKCNECGYYNEIKTEFQVFCPNCNKKLVNNYPNWKKQNFDKSFEDYQSLVCTTQKHEIPPTKIKSKKKQRLKYLVGFGIGFAIFFIVFSILGVWGKETIISLIKKPSYDQVMVVTANEINKTCPFMVDSHTRLDNVIVLPDNILQYNYTLINLAKDSINIQELKDHIEPIAINLIKTSPEMEDIRKHKSTINYFYKDMNGIYLFTISITPKQYES